MIDYEEPNGYGICYNYTETGDICQGVWRGVELYRDKKDEQCAGAYDAAGF